MLPWAHKAMVRDAFSPDSPNYTHLLYLEEDIRFGLANLRYFLRYNEILRPHGVIPGFIRVEFSEKLCDVCASDSPRSNGLDARNKFSTGDLDFVCLDEPYTGMYLLDAAQAKEYVASRSFDVEASLDVIGWGEPERAAMGLTFENPPAGHRWRMVLPLAKGTNMPHPCGWLHHLPNNYANNHAQDGNYPMGKLRLDALFA